MLDFKDVMCSERENVCLNWVGSGLTWSKNTSSSLFPTAGLKLVWF